MQAFEAHPNIEISCQLWYKTSFIPGCEEERGSYSSWHVIHLQILDSFLTTLQYLFNIYQFKLCKQPQMSSMGSKQCPQVCPLLLISSPCPVPHRTVLSAVLSTFRNLLVFPLVILAELWNFGAPSCALDFLLLLSPSVQAQLYLASVSWRNAQSQGPSLELSCTLFQRSSTAWLYLASLGIRGLYHYPKITLTYKTVASWVSAFPPRPLSPDWLQGAWQRGHSGASESRQRGPGCSLPHCVHGSLERSWPAF